MQIMDRFRRHGTSVSHNTKTLALRSKVRPKILIKLRAPVTTNQQGALARPPRDARRGADAASRTVLTAETSGGAVSSCASVMPVSCVQKRGSEATH